MNWRTIKDYPTYQISDTGLVMNKLGLIMKLSVSNQGYRRINLRNNNKKKHLYVHRLVAQAFIPNPENKSEVDHIDRSKDNNCISNLRWSTRVENCQNQGNYKSNTSGVKNISYNKRDKMYQFKKEIGGKKIQKTFKTLEEAIQFKNTNNYH